MRNPVHIHMATRLSRSTIGGWTWAKCRCGMERVVQDAFYRGLPPPDWPYPADRTWRTPEDLAAIPSLGDKHEAWGLPRDYHP